MMNQTKKKKRKTKKEKMVKIPAQSLGDKVETNRQILISKIYKEMSTM